MKKGALWLGLAAFGLALICVLPARWIAGLLPAELSCTTWSGTVWQGNCAGLRLQQPPGQAPLQAELLRWKLRPTALLRLALAGSFELRNNQDAASGQIELGRGGRIALQNVTISALLDRRLATMLAEGWNGQLEVHNLTLQMRGQLLQALSGELALRDFNDGHGGELGSYNLQVPPVAAPPFVGALRDAGGPLAVAASLSITADHHWRLAGTITPRPGTPGALRNRLDMLGAPDRAGRYPLTLEGVFN